MRGRLEGRGRESRGRGGEAMGEVVARVARRKGRREERILVVGKGFFAGCRGGSETESIYIYILLRMKREIGGWRRV